MEFHHILEVQLKEALPSIYSKSIPCFQDCSQYFKENIIRYKHTDNNTKFSIILQQANKNKAWL